MLSYLVFSCVILSQHAIICLHDPTHKYLFVRKYSQYRRLCWVFLSCVAAGVFVHCCSCLLSPICWYSLAWKQDRERFHTYTHWPLINKSDRGPFPHIHATQMKTKSIHTDTVPNHSNIPQHTLQDLHPTCCLSGSDLVLSQCFLSIKSGRLVMSKLLFSFILSDDCSLVAASENTGRSVPISCSLHGVNRYFYCANLQSNLSGFHEWAYWREECIPMNWQPCINVNGVGLIPNCLHVGKNKFTLPLNSIKKHSVDLVHYRIT